VFGATFSKGGALFRVQWRKSGSQTLGLLRGGNLAPFSQIGGLSPVVISRKILAPQIFWWCRPGDKFFPATHGAAFVRNFSPPEPLWRTFSTNLGGAEQVFACSRRHQYFGGGAANNTLLCEKKGPHRALLC